MKKLLNKLYSIKSDKWLHFIAGIIVSQLSFSILVLGFSNIVSMLLSMIVVVIVAGTKELIDTKYGVPSWNDFLFTVIGGVIGNLLSLIK